MNSFMAPRGQPSQQCLRFTYETGQTSQVPTAGITGAIIDPQRAQEEVSLVTQTASFLTQLDAVVPATLEMTATVWVLAWDVAATEAARTAATAGDLSAARYSYGPIVPGTTGGLLIREPQELFTFWQNGLVVDQFLAQPFDNGIVLALSATPILYAPTGGTMKVTARGRRA